VINGTLIDSAVEVAVFYQHHAADDDVCGQHRLRSRLHSGRVFGGEKGDCNRRYQAFIQYMRNFTQPITQLASISNTFQLTIARIGARVRILDEPEEIPERNLASASAATGAVSF